MLNKKNFLYFLILCWSYSCCYLLGQEASTAEDQSNELKKRVELLEKRIQKLEGSEPPTETKAIIEKPKLGVEKKDLFVLPIGEPIFIDKISAVSFSSSLLYDSEISELKNSDVDDFLLSAGADIQFSNFVFDDVYLGIKAKASHHTYLDAQDEDFSQAELGVIAGYFVLFAGYTFEHISDASVYRTDRIKASRHQTKLILGVPNSQFQFNVLNNWTVGDLDYYESGGNVQFNFKDGFFAFDLFLGGKGRWYTEDEYDDSFFIFGGMKTRYQPKKGYLIEGELSYDVFDDVYLDLGHKYRFSFDLKYWYLGFRDFSIKLATQVVVDLFEDDPDRRLDTRRDVDYTVQLGFIYVMHKYFYTEFGYSLQWATSNLNEFEVNRHLFEISFNATF